MRNLILLVSLCLMLISCRKTEDGDKYIPILVKNYVTYYIDQEEWSAYVAKMSTVNSPSVGISTDFNRGEEHDLYIAPELRQVLPSRCTINGERFAEIAARNNDLSYNKIRYWFFSTDGANAFMDNFSGIEVVCTNTAWDDAHPAGTSLNDLTRMTFSSYHDFVHSGYVGNEIEANERIDKRLTALSPTDLYMLSPQLRLKIDKTPSPGSYDIQITLTTVDGAKRTVSCTMEVE